MRGTSWQCRSAECGRVRRNARDYHDLVLAVVVAFAKEGTEAVRVVFAQRHELAQIFCVREAVRVL